MPGSEIDLHQPSERSSIHSKSLKYRRPVSVIRSHWERLICLRLQREEIARRLRSVKQRHPSSTKASKEVKWEILIMASSVNRRQLERVRDRRRLEAENAWRPFPWREKHPSSLATYVKCGSVRNFSAKQSINNESQQHTTTYLQLPQVRQMHQPFV